MLLSLRNLIQSSPTNSLSAIKQSMQLVPKSRIKRSTKSILSVQFELPQLIQHFEQQWESHSFVGYAQHKNVDVCLAKFPIGPIYTKLQTLFVWQQTKWVFSIEMNSLLLLSTLIFSIRKMSGLILLIC